MEFLRIHFKINHMQNRGNANLFVFLRPKRFLFVCLISYRLTI